MTDDVKALIAEAREYALTGNWKPATVLIASLADALEAATVAPAKTVQEVLELLDNFHGDNRMSYDAYTNLHDAVALLDARPAPAVDREALARLFDPWAWDYGDPTSGAVQVSRAETLQKADSVIASGILRDVRDVQAEALEQYADERWGAVGKRRKEDNSMFGEELRIREHAQAIREARSER